MLLDPAPPPPFCGFAYFFSDDDDDTDEQEQFRWERMKKNKEEDDDEKQTTILVPSRRRRHFETQNRSRRISNTLLLSTFTYSSIDFLFFAFVVNVQQDDIPNENRIFILFTTKQQSVSHKNNNSNNKVTTYNKTAVKYKTNIIFLSSCDTTTSNTDTTAATTATTTNTCNKTINTGANTVTVFAIMMKLQASHGGTMSSRSSSQLKLPSKNNNKMINQVVISSPLNHHDGHKTLLPGCFDLSYGGSDRWNTIHLTTPPTKPVPTPKSLCRQTTIGTKQGDADVEEKDANNKNKSDQSCHYLTASFFKSSPSLRGKPDTGKSGINDYSDEEQQHWSPRSTPLTVKIEEDEKEEEKEDDDNGEEEEEEEEDWDYEEEEYEDFESDGEEGFTLEPTYHTFEDDDISDLTDEEGFELYDILDQLFCDWVEDEDNIDGGSFVEYLSDGTSKVIDGEPIFALSGRIDDVEIENNNISNCFALYEEEDLESGVVNTVELPHLLGTFYDEFLEAADH